MHLLPNITLNNELVYNCEELVIEHFHFLLLNGYLTTFWRTFFLPSTPVFNLVTSVTSYFRDDMLFQSQSTFFN